MRVVLWILAAIVAYLGLRNLYLTDWVAGPGGFWTAAVNVARVVEFVVSLTVAVGFALWAERTKRRNGSSRLSERLSPGRSRKPANSALSGSTSTTQNTSPYGPRDDESARETLSYSPFTGVLRGDNLAAKSRVTVLGGTEAFAINPRVKIFWNNIEVGSVYKNGIFIFKIDGDGEIRFTSSAKSTSIPVNAGRDTTVSLSWNRTAWRLTAKVDNSASRGS